MKRKSATAIAELEAEVLTLMRIAEVVEALFSKPMFIETIELNHKLTPQSLYSDDATRFVENGRRYRFPSHSYKFPANDDGLCVLQRIMHQLAMPS